MRGRLHLTALRAFGLLPKRLQNMAVRLLSPTYTIGTAVIVSDAGGRILLVRQPYSDGWGLPGGLLDRTEEPDETAHRELVEELGLHVEITGHPVAVRTPWRRHFNFLFAVALPDGIEPDRVRPRSPEISAAAWFDPDDLPEDLAEFTDEFLAAVVSLQTV